ncbi:unnamed protein product [Staurois parvus]|uniref:Uncharacterized protein n=1 Tax=Staurois parvus TaxID=386267 RepID=A0ABN9EMS1_9NEOB|nr:unnamed protein product [Staurois parvus]
MLVILNVEPKGLSLHILQKICYILSSLILPFFYCLQSFCTCSDSFFFFLGRVNLISTGSFRTVQTEGQGLCRLMGQSR